MREAGNTGCKSTANISINQSHFSSFVIILIVHVLDKIQDIYIKTGKPIHHDVKTMHYFIIIKIITGNSTIFRTYLYTGFLINTAVNCIKHALCKVGTSSEELHFLTGFSCRYAAADRVIITPDRTHYIIILVLN